MVAANIGVFISTDSNCNRFFNLRVSLFYPRILCLFIMSQYTLRQVVNFSTIVYCRKIKNNKFYHKNINIFCSIVNIINTNFFLCLNMVAIK